MKKHVFPILLITITIILWLIFLPRLPENLPIHWGMNGKANGFAPRLNAMLLNVGLMVFMYVLYIYMPKLDPKKESYKLFSKSYHVIMYTLLILFFLMNIFIIMIGLGYNIPMANITGYVVGVILIVLGYVLKQVRSNFFIGIRTPWTLSSEKVWNKTHQFGSKVILSTGILLILLNLLHTDWINHLLLPLVILAFALPVIYSYFIYKQV